MRLRPIGLRPEEIGVEVVLTGARPCVRVFHIPTGKVASCDLHDSILRNKIAALTQLQQLVEQASGTP